MICIMKPNLNIVWKTKITFLLNKTLLSFFKQKYILFLETYFFKISKNLITSTFLSGEADTKKHRYASEKASNATLVKLILLYVCYFCVSDKHGQASNVIWGPTTWLLIFWREVANKKPLFTKPDSTWFEISW